MENLSKFYINGHWINPHGSDIHPLINPANEEFIAHVPMGSVDDVDRSVEAARNAFDTWSNTPPSTRIKLLERLLELYLENYEELAQLMSDEMGATRAFSYSAQAWTGQAHLENTIRALSTFKLKVERGDMTLVHEPIGVCALITPWNWPMNQLVVKVAPALAAGCTVVVKPSEYSPLSAVKFSELIDEAGFPPGVFNYILGSGEIVGSAMSKHSMVDMVSITGSTRAGVSVAKDAASTVKRVHQELGGKSANILLPDVDLEKCVKEGIDSCFLNCGQACRAPARMLVHKSQLDKAAEIGKAYIDTKVVGDPQCEDTDLGPVVNIIQFNRIQELIKSGIEGGAKLVTGGVGRPEGFDQGYYVKPTLFTEVGLNSRIATEEIFGPVITLIGYEDINDAIEIANSSVYGLSAYVQGDDLDKVRSVAMKLRAGTVYLNGAAWRASAPFGGYKQSGNGREHAEFGLSDFMELKAILE